MRDGGVSPVEGAAGSSEDVAGVHVRMVEAGRYAKVVELRAQRAQLRPQAAQALVLTARDSVGCADHRLDVRAANQLLELARDAAGAQVGQAEGEQVGGVRCQISLQPGVAAQDREPRVRGLR